jgi:hypothetical protein
MSKVFSFGSRIVETAFFFIELIFIYKITCIARILQGRSEGVGTTSPRDGTG